MSPATGRDMIPLGELEYRDLPIRKLDEETCRKWNYGISAFNSKPVQVACYYSPDGSSLVAQKLRFPDKTFTVLGNLRAAGLFGQNLWRDNGKMVVVTEGEIDSLSVSQAQGNRWPVVSVPNGAAGAAKAVAAASDWLEKFETVVFMFDMDEPGRAAAKACAEILKPGKAKIASLPLKDANEMIVAGRTKELIDAIWGAKEYRPDGIVPGTELWERIRVEKPNNSIEYPWAGLNNATMGCRKSEIITFCAGSGIGKSQVCREIAHHFITKHKEKVGYIALEESVERTALMLVGLELNKRVHLDRAGTSEEDLRSAFDATVGSGNLYLYDHFGSVDSDNLLARIRYLVRACGCGTIVLDHISIVVSGMEDGDERRLIDNAMTKLRCLVQELDCRLILVSHLKRTGQGDGHEEGAQVRLSQLRGSGAIGHISDIVVGLERDQQSENKNITTVRIVKNRWEGETGESLCLKYDKETGRMTEFQPEFEAASAGPESGISAF